MRCLPKTMPAPSPNSKKHARACGTARFTRRCRRAKSSLQTSRLSNPVQIHVVQMIARVHHARLRFLILCHGFSPFRFLIRRLATPPTHVFWSDWVDSNHRHHAYKAYALPTELQSVIMAVTTIFAYPPPSSAPCTYASLYCLFTNNKTFKQTN